jgi:hypothetical protein
VFKDGLDRGKLFSELGIGEDRMYLAVADTVQADAILSALAFGNEMMLVPLILRDDAFTHRTKHGLWLRLVP